MTKIKILVFASSRADYSLLQWLFNKQNNLIKFELVISFSKKNNNFSSSQNNNKVRIVKYIKLLSTFNKIIRYENITKIIKEVSKIFITKKYDYFLVLGDRYEVFAATISANNFQIPIIHLSGGLLSMGSQDEFYRHAITKMAFFHFTTSNQSKKRVIQMGEEPSRVFNYGSLGVESIKSTKLINKKEIQKSRGIVFLNKCILITVHPNTSNSKKKEIDIILTAIKKIDQTTFVFTSPNFDPGYADIIQKIKKFIKFNDNSYYFDDLTHQEYLSIMKLSDIVLGNSSSGFYQAPFMKVPTINIGDRQKGRESCGSIIDTKVSIKDIYSKCIKILFNKNKIDFTNFPYGNGNTSEKIINRIIKLPKYKKIKVFFNLNS